MYLPPTRQQVTRWWLANASYMHYGSKEPGGDLLGTFPGGSTSYLLYRKVDSTLVNSTFTVNPTTTARRTTLLLKPFGHQPAGRAKAEFAWRGQDSAKWLFLGEKATWRQCLTLHRFCFCYHPLRGLRP